MLRWPKIEYYVDLRPFSIKKLPFVETVKLPYCVIDDPWADKIAPILLPNLHRDANKEVLLFLEMVFLNNMICKGTRTHNFTFASL